MPVPRRISVPAGADAAEITNTPGTAAADSMKPFYAMRGSIRHYAWGHSRWIPEFLNTPHPPNTPVAELWMGAHSSAPSRIAVGGGKWENLDEWIQARPKAALGEKTARDFGRLPFLFKLLAAGKALSIQAHPSLSLAREGFARENAAGIPLSAAQRSYKDDNHKPEIIMALSTFTAMIGFRPPEEIHRSFAAAAALVSSAASKSSSAWAFGILESVLPPPVKGKALNNSDQHALEGFLSQLLRLPVEPLGALLSAVRMHLDRGGEGLDPLQREWIGRLFHQFPGDAGALAPLFLNIVQIEPGEAIYQPAGVLHAYLEGFGVELMANSDNVLRGGLTPKNIDVDELLKVLEFRPFAPEVLRLDSPRPSDSPRPPDTPSAPSRPAFFETPAREFALGITSMPHSAGEGEPIVLPGGSGPFIVLSIEGRAELSSGNQKLVLPRGASAFIPFEAPDVHIRGRARTAVAGVGR